MSSTVEDRRQDQIIDQKKVAEQKTAKEKEASAAKFKQTIAGKLVTSQKSEANQKETAQKQSFNQNLMMSKNGIAGRNLAERLVKNQESTEKADKELTGSREKDLKSDSERVDGERSDARAEAQEAQVQQQQFDAPVKRDDEQHAQDGQGKGQGQGQGQQQQQQGGQQGQGKDREDGGIGGVGGASKAAASGGAGGAGKADNAQSPTKIAIGKTQRAAAAERIPTQVLQGVVDKVSVMCTQNMGEFQIQLKDDAMGGGTLRVTLKDKKLKIAFTLKDNNAKNLIESQKGVLMRMFERKGLALESMTVSVRQ